MPTGSDGKPHIQVGPTQDRHVLVAPVVLREPDIPPRKRSKPKASKPTAPKPTAPKPPKPTAPKQKAKSNEAESAPPAKRAAVTVSYSVPMAPRSVVIPAPSPAASAAASTSAAASKAAVAPKPTSAKKKTLKEKTLKERCLKAAALVDPSSAHCPQEDRGELLEEFSKFPNAVQRLYDDIRRRDLATVVGFEYVEDLSKNEELLVDVLNDSTPAIQEKLQELNDATDAQEIARLSASVLSDYSKLEGFEVEDDDKLAGQKLEGMSDESSGVSSGCDEDLEMDDERFMQSGRMAEMAGDLNAEASSFLLNNIRETWTREGLFFFQTANGTILRTEEPCRGVLTTDDRNVQCALGQIHDDEITKVSIRPNLLTEAPGGDNMFLQQCEDYLITDAVNWDGTTLPRADTWGGYRAFRVVSHDVNEMQVQRVQLIQHDSDTAAFGRRKRRTKRVDERLLYNVETEVERSNTFTRDGRQKNEEQPLPLIKGLVYVRFVFEGEEYEAEIVTCDTGALVVKIDNGGDSHDHLWQKTLDQLAFEKTMLKITETLPGVAKVERVWVDRVAPPHHIAEEINFEDARGAYGVATHMITPEIAQRLGREPGPLDCLVKLDEKKTSGKGKTPADYAGTYNVVLRGDVINNADLTKPWRVLPPDTQLPGSNMQENMTLEAYAMLCKTLRAKHAVSDIKFSSAEWNALTRKHNLGHWGPDDWVKVNFGLTAGVDNVQIVAPHHQGWRQRYVFLDERVKVTKDAVRELTLADFDKFAQDNVTVFEKSLQYLDHVQLQLRVSELCCVVGIGEQKTQIEECLRELHACVNNQHCLRGCRKDRIRVLFLDLEDDQSAAESSATAESGDESKDSVSSGSPTSGSDEDYRSSDEDWEA